MAKKDADKNKETVEKPLDGLQDVPERAGKENNELSTESTKEVDQEELQVLQEQGGGEETNAEGRSDMDSEGEAATTEEKRGGADHTVTDDELDNDAEETYKEAKEVITELVSEALDESGLLDEPIEKTEHRNRIAKDVFDKSAQTKTLYFTSDLIPFFVKTDAIRHAGSKLEDDTIVTINRK